jgi:hypothetical protein
MVLPPLPAQLPNAMSAVVIWPFTNLAAPAGRNRDD